ncbi:MAG TPA: hypothetical protein DDW52_01750 [Planctomycetaceae bacterium]|nr:hypothetical protein [Planctomycetaceae bacterium]
MITIHKKPQILCGLLMAAAVLSATPARADGPFSRLINRTPASNGDAWAQAHAANRPWHGNYYYLPYGQPTALVMPQRAVMQSNYSWGVSRNTMTPIYHQFGAAATPSAGGAFLGTPPWPSNTNQFGVYPVRARW